MTNDDRTPRDHPDAEPMNGRVRTERGPLPDPRHADTAAGSPGPAHAPGRGDSPPQSSTSGASRATTHDNDRGEDDAEEKRLARRPEGPAHERKSGLGATLKRTLSEFQEDNGTDWAAALTYYAVLSVFPALIAMISVVGLVGDPKTVTDKLTTLATDIGPPSAAETLRGPIQGLTAGGGTAGILLIAGLVAALWSASGYIGAFSRASNDMYEVEEGRPIYKLRPLQMLVTLVQVLLLALVAVAVVATGTVATSIGSAFGISSTVVTVWSIAKWPVMVILVLLAIGLLYYASPNARLRGFKSVLPGAVLGVVIWLLASVAFAFYVANFGSYNKTYGTLGGIISFLVWLWITNVAIVFGVAFNAERERSAEIADGALGAERELQVEQRDEPKLKKRAKTG